jgi:riboflavin synthase
LFTGIVKAVGILSAKTLAQGEGRLTFQTGKLDLSRTQLGDSIAVCGCCLTVVELRADGFVADVSRETLALTTLGELNVGDPVNLESALSLQDALGGHLVTGHVDGVGEVLSIEPNAQSIALQIRVPEALALYVAKKGSICVDGISLTVNDVAGAVAHLTIVPHTMEETIIANYVAGTRVNIEADIIARYLERISQYT